MAMGIQQIYNEITWSSIVVAGSEAANLKAGDTVTITGNGYGEDGTYTICETEMEDQYGTMWPPVSYDEFAQTADICINASLTECIDYCGILEPGVYVPPVPDTYSPARVALRKLSGQDGYNSQLNTDGDVALIPAFQSVFLVDGTEGGFYEIDMVSTRIHGTISEGATEAEQFDSGESVIQHNNTDAKGVLRKKDSTNDDLYVYRTDTTEFDSTNVINEDESDQAVLPKITPSSVADVQTLRASAVAASGGYRIELDGETTATLQYNDSYATIQSALEGLSGVGTGNVLVSGSLFSDATVGLVLTFSASLEYVEPVVITTNSLQDAASQSISITVEHTTYGKLAVKAPPNFLDWNLKQGSFPDGGSNIGCLYRGRIVLNSVYNENQWFMTRQGDPYDLLFSQDDEGTPVSSQTSSAGLVGDAIRAFIPYQDHYLIIGCVNQVWVLRGDPAQGGTVTNISMETGIFSPTSWCWDDNGNLYFIGTDGIYKLPAGAAVNNEPPLNISSYNIPNLMKQLKLNRRTDRVNMAYDKQRDGILIAVTQKDGAWSVNFWYDIKTGGFFPEEYAGGCKPTSMLYYDDMSGSNRGLLMGDQDGYIRKFEEQVKGDETTASTDADFEIDIISSEVLIGPVEMSRDTRGEQRLMEVAIRTGEGSDSVDFDIYAADTGEELSDATINNSIHRGTVEGGKLSRPARPNVRGSHFGVKLKNANANETWVLEDISLKFRQSGKID